MRKSTLSLSIGAALACALTAHASSHREAPAIAGMPEVDATDFYMFNSYETGREGFVTLIANYVPLQSPYGGPNYFALDDTARYEINIDNDGDAKEDISFHFHFRTEVKGAALDVGGTMVPIPLINAGPVGPGAADTMNLNRVEMYRIDVVRGDRVGIVKAKGGTNDDRWFVKPVDNIGNKSIADYAAYAEEHIYDIDVPGCATQGRMFVGQRKDPFVVNLGEVFDLINTDPLGPPDAEQNDLADKNVTTFALELPAECLTAREPIIGGWTTASKRQIRNLRGDGTGESGGYVQVSRLGHALVNEVVIGLPDKDAFNAAPPRGDAQFLTYVTNPTLPALIETLFPAAEAPAVFPRQDLVDVFLLGVEGVNRPTGVVPAEMLRLNTSVAAAAASNQDPLGVLAKDSAGYPNGRRPGDDVVDISLRVAMGALLPAEDAPAGQLPLTDGARGQATDYDEAFPYLLTPIPGSPAEAREDVADDAVSTP